MGEMDKFYEYASFPSASITFPDEKKVFHLRIYFKVICYSFYSGSKSLQ